MSGPVWMRMDRDFGLPSAVLKIGVLEAMGLGMRQHPDDDGSCSNAESARIMASSLEAIFTEIQPSLHGCCVVAIGLDMPTLTLTALVVHSLLPLRKPGDKAAEIDLTVAAREAYERRR